MSLTASQPIFSVVIPVFNVERYINTCLDSVLAQTFSNFEVICVIDGSTDDSLERISEYSDPRIRIICQENKGLAAARNTGINHSRGIYVALLDADDYWLAGKLAAHAKHLSNNAQVDVSYSASLFVDSENGKLGIGQYPRLKNISPEHIFCRNPVGNGSAAVMRRSLLVRMGTHYRHQSSGSYEYFDETLRQSEDIEFWLRAALDYDAKFEGIDQALTCYRVNASGLSANLAKQFNFWQKGIEKNLSRHPKFYATWYPRAAAYQQRYLARRAIQSGNASDALEWLRRAVTSDWRIVIDEPARTLTTAAAALCRCLPDSVYQTLQSFAIRHIGAKS